MERITANCAFCGKEKLCKLAGEKSLPDCPTRNHPELKETVIKNYQKPENRDFYLHSLRQAHASNPLDDEGIPRPSKSRADEIADFCHRMGYKKLGLAFCAAVEPQARKFTRILQDNGFEVVSVICKVGGIEKREVGLTAEEYVLPHRLEVACNPLEQAEICNAAGTQFNITLGLCVGHDALFFKNSKAFCTVFAVKDRVFANNPMQRLE